MRRAQHVKRSNSSFITWLVVLLVLVAVGLVVFYNNARTNQLGNVSYKEYESLKSDNVKLVGFKEEVKQGGTRTKIENGQQITENFDEYSYEVAYQYSDGYIGKEKIPYSTRRYMQGEMERKYETNKIDHPAVIVMKFKNDRDTREYHLDAVRIKKNKVTIPNQDTDMKLRTFEKLYKTYKLD